MVLFRRLKFRSELELEESLKMSHIQCKLVLSLVISLWLKTTVEAAIQSSNQTIIDQQAEEQRLAVHIVTTEGVGAPSIGNIQEQNQVQRRHGRGTKYWPLGEETTITKHLRSQSSSEANQQNHQRLIPRRIIINLGQLASTDSPTVSGGVVVGPMGSKQQEIKNTSKSQQVKSVDQSSSKSLPAALKSIRIDKADSRATSVVGSQRPSNRAGGKQAGGASMRQAIMSAISKQGGIPTMILSENEMADKLVGAQEPRTQGSRQNYPSPSSSQTPVKLMLNAEMIDQMQRRGQLNGRHERPIESPSARRTPNELNVVGSVQGDEDANKLAGQSSSSSGASVGSPELNPNAGAWDDTKRGEHSQRSQSLRQERVWAHLSNDNIEGAPPGMDNYQDGRTGRADIVSYDDELMGKHAFSMDSQAIENNLPDFRNLLNDDQRGFRSDPRSQRRTREFYRVAASSSDSKQEVMSKEGSKKELGSSQKANANVGQSKATSAPQLVGSKLEKRPVDQHSNRNATSGLKTKESEARQRSAPQSSKTKQRQQQRQEQRQQQDEPAPPSSPISEQAMGDRVARLLDRLKLYTTKDQLMKVAQDLQQTPTSIQEGDTTIGNNSNDKEETNAGDQQALLTMPLEGLEGMRTGGAEGLTYEFAPSDGHASLAGDPSERQPQYEQVAFLQDDDRRPIDGRQQAIIQSQRDFMARRNSVPPPLKYDLIGHDNSGNSNSNNSFLEDPQRSDQANGLQEGAVDKEDVDSNEIDTDERRRQLEEEDDHNDAEDEDDNHHDGHHSEVASDGRTEPPQESASVSSSAYNDEGANEDHSAHHRQDEQQRHQQHQGGPEPGGNEASNELDFHEEDPLERLQTSNEGSAVRAADGSYRENASQIKESTTPGEPANNDSHQSDVNRDQGDLEASAPEEGGDQEQQGNKLLASNAEEEMKALEQIIDELIETERGKKVN